MNNNFQTRIIHLAPILWSLFFGILCAYVVLTSSIDVYQITPFPENVTGSFGNAFYFVILVGIGAFMMYFFLKMKSHRLINMIIGFVFTIAVFMLSIIYSMAFFSNFTFQGTEAFILFLSFAITVLADYAVFRAKSKIRDFVVLCLGGALGAFLGASIPTLSAMLILLFLAVYDVFAVYHGPVGKIARSGLDQLRGLSFSFRDIQMGLGDLTFYSMLVGHIFLYFGFALCMASTVGILLGCLLTFRVLETKGMFPGLPLPIVLGLLPLIVSLLLS